TPTLAESQPAGLPGDEHKITHPQNPPKQGGPPTTKPQVRTPRPLGQPSKHRKQRPELVRRHLTAVVVPLDPLVAEEEVVDVLAERLGQQLGALHLPQRLTQVLRQLRISRRLAFGVG